LIKVYLVLAQGSPVAYITVAFKGKVRRSIRPLN